MAIWSAALAIPILLTSAQSQQVFSGPATLPVLIVRGADAANAARGDRIEAVTVQNVLLATGVLLRGSRVIGHVVEAHQFTSNRKPYAEQTPGSLTLCFDYFVTGGRNIPLHTSVRALASPLAVSEAEEAWTNSRPLPMRTLIGGDLLIPSQEEVRDRRGKIIAYNRSDGVYAQLIQHGDCDGNDSEVSVAMFSPSACGLYGYSSSTALKRGSLADSTIVTLLSTQESPRLLKHSAALLETLAIDKAGEHQ